MPSNKRTNMASGRRLEKAANASADKSLDHQDEPDDVEPEVEINVPAQASSQKKGRTRRQSLSDSAPTASEVEARHDKHQKQPQREHRVSVDDAGTLENTGSTDIVDARHAWRHKNSDEDRQA